MSSEFPDLRKSPTDLVNELGAAHETGYIMLKLSFLQQLLVCSIDVIHEYAEELRAGGPQRPGVNSLIALYKEVGVEDVVIPPVDPN